MTIKDKLKKAGIIGLASLVGVMPLKAQEMGRYRTILCPPYHSNNISELLYEVDGKKIRFIDGEEGKENDSPDHISVEGKDVGEIELNGENNVEPLYGTLFRNKKKEILDFYVNRFKEEVKNNKVYMQQQPQEYGGQIQISVEGNDKTEYCVIADKEGITKRFDVTLPGSKDSLNERILVNIMDDNSEITKNMIRYLANWVITEKAGSDKLIKKISPINRNTRVTNDLLKNIVEDIEKTR